MAPGPLDRWNLCTVAVDDQALADVKITGIAKAYEKELFRKGGTRVPVLAGAAVFDRARNEGVAFMVDLSYRRRAENAARKASDDNTTYKSSWICMSWGFVAVKKEVVKSKR